MKINTDKLISLLWTKEGRWREDALASLLPALEELAVPLMKRLDPNAARNLHYLAAYGVLIIREGGSGCLNDVVDFYDIVLRMSSYTASVCRDKEEEARRRGEKVSQKISFVHLKVLLTIHILEDNRDLWSFSRGPI